MVGFKSWLYPSKSTKLPFYLIQMSHHFPGHCTLINMNNTGKLVFTNCSWYIHQLFLQLESSSSAPSISPCPPWIFSSTFLIWGAQELSPPLWNDRWLFYRMSYMSLWHSGVIWNLNFGIGVQSINIIEIT